MDRVDRRAALLEALRRLGMIVEGVSACVVVNDDGFAIAAYSAGMSADGAQVDPSAAQVAAVSAALAGMAERALDRLAQGKMGRLLLEGENGSLLTCPAGQVTLAVVVEPGASMGHVLFAAQKTADEIESILERR